MKNFVVAVLAVFCIAVSLNAQVYRNVKVNMSNGLQVKGISATIENDTLSMQSRGVTRRYSMSQVNSMMAKSGKAEKFAIGCGAGCLAYCIVNAIALGPSGFDEYNTTITAYVAESILVTGATAGIGYLIGSLLDPYEVVYIKGSSFLDKVRLNITTDQFALDSKPGRGQKPLSMSLPMLSLSYRF